MQLKSIYIKIYNVTFTTFWYIEFRLSVVNFGIIHRRVLEFWLNAYIWIVSDMKEINFQNYHYQRGCSLPIVLKIAKIRCFEILYLRSYGLVILNWAYILNLQMRKKRDFLMRGGEGCQNYTFSVVRVISDIHLKLFLCHTHNLYLGHF